MQCARCGTEAAPDHVYCSNCGSPLGRAMAALPVAAAPPDPPAPTQGAIDALEARVAALEDRLPRSNIISKKFWARAFTVLGHQISAALTIYAVILVIALMLMALAAMISLVTK